MPQYGSCWCVGALYKSQSWSSDLRVNGLRKDTDYSMWAYRALYIKVQKSVLMSLNVCMGL